MSPRADAAALVRLAEADVFWFVNANGRREIVRWLLRAALRIVIGYSSGRVRDDARALLRQLWDTHWCVEFKRPAMIARQNPATGCGHAPRPTDSPA